MWKWQKNKRLCSLHLSLHGHLYQGKASTSTLGPHRAFPTQKNDSSLPCPLPPQVAAELPFPPSVFQSFFLKKKNFHFFIFFSSQGEGSFFTRGLLMKAADTPRGLSSPNRAQCQAEGRMLSPGWARLGTPEQGFFIPNAGRVWSSRALAMKDLK